MILRKAASVAAAIALVLLSPSGAIPTANDNVTMTSTADELVPIKEIVNVRITPGANFLKLLCKTSGECLAKKLTHHQDKLFIEFVHRGAVRGTSLPLNNLLEASYVNLPILADDEGMMEPIKCLIKRNKRFWPDKVLFTADVVFRDGVQPKSVIRDMKGRDIGARIELKIWDTEYIAATVEGSKVNRPSRVDFFYKALVGSLPMILDKFFIKCDGDDCMKDFKKPIDQANPDLPMVSELDGYISYPTSDQFDKPLWEVKYIVPFVNWLLPFTKRNNPVGDRVALRNNIRVSKLGNNVKQPWEGRWKSPLSDASMTRLFFYALGHFKTRTVRESEDKFVSIDGIKNAYVADMTLFANSKYRDDFENFGCKVYFDTNQTITMIEDYDGSAILPGSPRWERMKQKGRSALFIEVSLIHLIQYHLMWGNIPATALRKYLAPDHPIRIALTTHFFRTHQTCLQSKGFLTSKRGALGRSLPFQYDGKGGYKDTLIAVKNRFEFKLWSDEVKEKGIDFSVGATDGVDLHKVLSDYVSNLVDEIYPKSADFYDDNNLYSSYEFLADNMYGVPREFTMDNFKKVWGEILMRVTGLHTSAGNAAIAAVEPFFVNFRQEKSNRDKVVAGSREVISTVSTITGLTMPNQYPNLLQNWTHLLHNETGHSDAYDQLKTDLVLLGDRIEARNKERQFVNVDFHPQFAAISIFS